MKKCYVWCHITRVCSVHIPAEYYSGFMKVQNTAKIDDLSTNLLTPPRILTMMHIMQ